MTEEETPRKTKQREMSGRERAGVQKEFRNQKCRKTDKTSRASSEDEEARARDDDLERS